MLFWGAALLVLLWAVNDICYTMLHNNVNSLCTEKSVTQPTTTLLSVFLRRQTQWKSKWIEHLVQGIFLLQGIFLAVLECPNLHLKTEQQKTIFQPNGIICAFWSGVVFRMRTSGRWCTKCKYYFSTSNAIYLAKKYNKCSRGYLYLFETSEYSLNYILARNSRAAFSICKAALWSAESRFIAACPDKKSRNLDSEGIPKDWGVES